MAVLTVLDILLAIVGVLLVKHLISRKPIAPLPPGPKKFPLLGNLLDMPTEKEWLAFTDWGTKWGHMVSVSVFGQQLIIINSAKTAIDMMDKKSSIYSDRPTMQMGGELVGWKNTLVLVPYGERFRTYRTFFHQLIGSNATMADFHPVEEMETHRFLKHLLSKPQNLAEHVRKTAGAVILRISHGYEVKEKDDPFVTLANEATDQFSLSTAPGGFLVNLIPALRHVPDWFPGAGFKKTAKTWAATLSKMVESPHEYVKQQMAEGTAEASFTSRLLEEPGLTPDREFEIMWSAGSLYSGGADTTVSAIYAFFKAMALFPEAQAKAQAEIDAVAGSDRLPTFHDREKLPYCNALALEVLRWHAVTPTGVPHRVMEDNVHEGYLIPKGALVIPNIWHMLHDPEMYSDPMTFKPERFLGNNPEEDPRNICFGFGRRICPGRVLADASIFISGVMSLAVFNISKYSENGRIIEPIVDQTTGTISHPTHFQCSIKPRSEKAIQLINSDEYVLGTKYLFRSKGGRGSVFIYWKFTIVIYFSCLMCFY